MTKEAVTSRFINREVTASFLTQTTAPDAS